MNHPMTRLLTALEVLQSCEQISGVAARLEVDPRTVRRYMMMLQDMGIPIGTELGRYGGYSLLPGFKLPPMMFTNEEVHVSYNSLGQNEILYRLTVVKGCIRVLGRH